MPAAKRARGRGGASARSVLFADEQVPTVEEVVPEVETFFRIRNRSKEETAKQKQVSSRNTKKRLKLIICNSDF